MHDHPYFNLALAPTILICVVLGLLAVLIGLLIAERRRSTAPEQAAPCDCRHLTPEQIADLQTALRAPCNELHLTPEQVQDMYVRFGGADAAARRDL